MIRTGELASGLGSTIGVSSVGGPRYAAALEIQADVVAVARRLVTIDNLCADCDFILQGSDRNQLSAFPSVARNHPSAVCTDVVGVGQLPAIYGLTLFAREAYNNSDW